MRTKIIELFEMLPRGEQLDLLRDLNVIVTDENPIIDLGLRCQIKYKENVVFTITTNNTVLPPVITAELTTPFGKFIAEGRNKKIAKAKAAEVALLALDEID